MVSKPTMDPEPCPSHAPRSKSPDPKIETQGKGPEKQEQSPNLSPCTRTEDEGSRLTFKRAIRDTGEKEAPTSHLAGIISEPIIQPGIDPPLIHPVSRPETGHGEYQRKTGRLLNRQQENPRQEETSSETKLKSQKHQSFMQA